MDSLDQTISERTMEYLDAIAVHGGMRAAADALGVNASTLSRQIALLERQLRLALLTRRGRSISLTEAGLAVVEHRRERARQDQLFRMQLDEYRRLRRGRLTIGVAEGFVHALITGVLKKFNARFPDISLELRSGALPDLLRMVRDDHVDICLCVGASRDPALSTRRFQSEPLCAIVPVHHPLAALAQLPIAALASQPLVFMPEHFAVQRHVDAMLHAEHVIVAPAFRCDRFATALTLAAEGLGIPFMTRCAAQGQIAAGQVVAVPLDHPIARTFDRHIVTRAGRRLPPAANYLWKEIVRSMSVV